LLFLAVLRELRPSLEGRGEGEKHPHFGLIRRAEEVLEGELEGRKRLEKASREGWEVIRGPSCCVCERKWEEGEREGEIEAEAGSVRREGDVKRDVNTGARHCGRVAVAQKEESKATTGRRGKRKGENKDKRNGFSFLAFDQSQSTREHRNAIPSTIPASAKFTHTRPVLPASLVVVSVPSKREKVRLGSESARA
jgi:hypothetical protein